MESAQQYPKAEGLYASKHAPSAHKETPRFTPTVQPFRPGHIPRVGQSAAPLESSYGIQSALPHATERLGGGDTQRVSEQHLDHPAWPSAGSMVPIHNTGGHNVQSYHHQHDNIALARLERHSGNLARLFAETQATHQYDLRKIEHKVDKMSASSTSHRADVDEELRYLQTQITQMALQVEKLQEDSALVMARPTSETCPAKDERREEDSDLLVKNDGPAVQRVEQDRAELPNQVTPMTANAPLTQHADTTSAIPATDVPATAATPWQPLYVRSLPASKLAPRVQDNQELFTSQQIHKVLKGKEWSPNFFVCGAKSMVRNGAYWVLDTETEPFIPIKPGDHGAKLTPFFNETPSEQAPTVSQYQHIPVFVRAQGADGYRYLGTYTAERFSDKVGYDVMMEHIPVLVLRHWAKYLSNKKRPGWVTGELIMHFWPMPRYCGPPPTDSAINTPATIDSQTSGVSTEPIEKQVQRALNHLAEDLKAWEKDTRFRASLITEETIMTAFNAADADAEPGLRLWWEYLQCVGYDEAFYQMLLSSRSWKGAPTELVSSAKQVQSRKQTDITPMPMPAKGNQEVEPVKQDDFKPTDVIDKTLVSSNAFDAIAVEGRSSQEDAWKQADEMILPQKFSTSRTVTAIQNSQLGSMDYYTRNAMAQAKQHEASRKAEAAQEGKRVSSEKPVNMARTEQAPARRPVNNYVPPHKRSTKDRSVQGPIEGKDDKFKHPGGEKHKDMNQETGGPSGKEAGKRTLKDDLEEAKQFNASATKAKQRR